VGFHPPRVGTKRSASPRAFLEGSAPGKDRHNWGFWTHHARRIVALNGRSWGAALCGCSVSESSEDRRESVTHDQL
jgi:hypothetical protein